MKKRKGINKKIILGIASLIGCLGIIIVTSFFPLIFHPENFLTSEFLTNELIIIAIVIFSMVASIFIGQASNGSNANSKIAKAKVSFNESVAKITNINAFFQWIRKVQQPKDVQSIRERELRNVGIEDYNVLNLEISQINGLIEKSQKYDGTYYKAITEEQAKAIIYIKTKLKIDLVEPSYYLTFHSNDANKTITERAGNESKKKSATISTSIISKCVLTLMVAMVWAGLGYDNEAVVESAQVWSNFVSRMMALLSSAFMGFIVGSQINDIDASFIEMRVIVHKQFLEDTEFKPLTQQEEAKQEFIERVNKENKESILLIGNGGDTNESR